MISSFHSKREMEKEEEEVAEEKKKKTYQNKKQSNRLFNKSAFDTDTYTESETKSVKKKGNQIALTIPACYEYVFTVCTKCNDSLMAHI